LLWCRLAFSRKLGLLSLAPPLFLVGFDFSLDALLGINVGLLLSSLLGGVFDLLLAL
jgi:hypothetical protein